MTTLAPFELHRVATVAEASRTLEELGDDAVIYAGGTELLLLLKLGFAEYGHLVDIKPIEELHTLEVRDGWLRIGGAVTHRAIEQSPIVREGWPDLAIMERGVANVRVRSTGSLGGNLAFADPHSDPTTWLLAAGARVELGRGEERRTVPMTEFVLGPYTTVLEPGELLTAIEVPALPVGTALEHLRMAFHERPAATVTARVRVDAEGRVAEADVAIGSVGIMPVLTPGVTQALSGSDAGSLPDAALAVIGGAAADASEPAADSNGSEAYKRSLVATLTGRALRGAATNALERR